MGRRNEVAAASDKPDVERIVAQIIARLEAAPPRTASIRSVRKEASRSMAHLSPQTVLRVAHQLIKRAPFGRFVAYELVQHHAATMASLSREEIERLGRGMSDWAAVDTFASYVSGPAWRAGSINDAAIHEWARSEDRWWRR